MGKTVVFFSSARKHIVIFQYRHTDNIRHRTMRLSCYLVLFLAGYIHTQTNFGDSSSSNNNRGSSSSGDQTNNRIFGIVPGVSSGNGLIDTALNVGLGVAGLGTAGVLTGVIDPCGKRKKRQTNFGNGDSNNNGDSTDSRLFLPNCNNQNNFNNGGGNFNTGAGCNCRCSTLTFSQNGVTYGNCRAPDNTGRYWCYTTGWNNNGCGDLQQSSRYPSNPWSYRACQVQGQCYNNQNNFYRDCKGRPQGDKYYGCGCNNGRKKRQSENTRIFDIRCAAASILGRNAPSQQK